MKISLLVVLTFCSAFISKAQTPSSWKANGIGGGGALFAPTINPADNYDYYISSDGSAIYHTTDNGKSYSILNGQQIQGGHISNVWYTSTPNLLYSVNSAYNEVVPVKSTDNGVTWQQLPGNPDSTNETFSLNVNYANPNQLVLDYYNVIYFSNDGGNTFTDIHNEKNNNVGVFVAGLFFDGSNIYICTNDGILESINGGANFTLYDYKGIPGYERVYAMAGAKQGGVTKFICLTADSDNVYNALDGSDYYGLIAGVYEVDYNSSTTWVRKTTGIDTTTDYMMFAGMAGNDTATCYLAGGSGAGVPDVMKTGNGGNSWAHVFNTTDNANIITGWCGSGGDLSWYWAESPFGFYVSPTNSNVAVMGDYGFIHRTDNGGTTWNQAYVDTTDEHPTSAATPTKQSYHSVGMENTSCWDVFWADENDMWSGYSDIFAIRSVDAGASWSFNYNYTPTNCVYRFAKSNSGKTLYAATSTVHDIYATYKVSDASLNGTGNVIYSTNNGDTWNQLYNFSHPVYWLATDPNDSERMYAAVVYYSSGVSGSGIYVTNNLGMGAAATWAQLATPPRTQGHPSNIVVLTNGNLLCSYSGRYSGSTFTKSSGVFLYNVTLQTWTDVSGAGLDYYTQDVVVDPNDATQQTWLAGVYDGFGGNGNGLGGLYMTKNGGTLWTEFLSGLNVVSCTFNPANADEVYVTTNGNGLYYSNNINSGSPTFSLVSSYYFANPTRVFFNPYNSHEIWVASMEYGMDIGNDTATATGIVHPLVKSDISVVYPNPAADEIQLQFSLPVNGTLLVYDITGRLVRKIYLSATQNYKLNCGNYTDGMYLLKFINDTGNVSATKVMVMHR